jgi:hypothetical protein
MSYLYKIMPLISGSRPSYGTLLIAVFAILALISTLRQGRGGVVLNIISLYMTIAVTNFLPFLNLEIHGFKVENYPLMKVGIFVVIFLLINLFLSHSSLGCLDTGRSTLLSTIVLSLLASGLLISAVAVMLPPNLKNELTGIAQIVFVNELARFAWVLAPIIFIVLIG